MRTIFFGSVTALVLASVSLLVAQTPSPVPTQGHAAVGSFFGAAIELCPQGVAPAACAGGNPALTLFMTPTLHGDGTFLGNDSFTLGAAPFGPHTTAHGQWIATSSTEFTADYTFMLNAFPAKGDGAIQALRFRWQGQVLDRQTLIGYVNMYFSPPMTLPWVNLLPNEFPVLPPQTSVPLTPPSTFYRDPTLCRTAGCPLVFKFTVKRVAP
jgi:hypothetical protein